MSLFDSRYLVPLVALLAACGTKDASKSAAKAPDSTHAAAVVPHQMTITATDYAFQAPDQVPSGMTTVHLVDNGSEIHHVSFIKLTDGKTIADFQQLLKNPGPMPAWASEAGGVNPPRPGGGMATATQMLEPGNYALICFIPSADGVPHFAKGMIHPLTVVPDSGAVAAPPTADVTLTLEDYKFTTSKPITAGRHTIEVKNNGSQPHELFIGKLMPGKKAADIPVWTQTMKGPPPVDPMGGVAGMSKGESSYITVDFTPGDYAFACFVPDAKDGKPHIAHGMLQQIHVE